MERFFKEVFLLFWPPERGASNEGKATPTCSTRPILISASVFCYGAMQTVSGIHGAVVCMLPVRFHLPSPLVPVPRSNLFQEDLPSTLMVHIRRQIFSSGSAPFMPVRNSQVPPCKPYFSFVIQTLRRSPLSSTPHCMRGGRSPRRPSPVSLRFLFADFNPQRSLFLASIL